MRTSGRPISSDVASRLTTDALARPRSGGAATRSFQASPWRPTTAERPAPGETRRLRRMVRGSMPQDRRPTLCPTPRASGFPPTRPQQPVAAPSPGPTESHASRPSSPDVPRWSGHRASGVSVNSAGASSTTESAERSSAWTRRTSPISGFLLADRVAHHLARLGVRLGHDHVGLAAGGFLEILRRALGRDEGRAEQALELDVTGHLGLELLDALDELRALAPDGLEAVGDVVHHPMDGCLPVAEEATLELDVSDLDRCECHDDSLLL